MSSLHLVQAVCCVLMWVAAVGSADSSVCPELSVPGGTINLAQAPIEYLHGVPFAGDPGFATHADLGIGICRHFHSQHHPCQGHADGYFSLAVITIESPVCIATFPTFITNYFWNGEAVEGYLTNSAANTWAHVFLYCAPNPNATSYNAMVSEDSSGIEYNITIATPLACPGTSPSVCPVIIVGKNESVNLKGAPSGILENVPFSGDGGNGNATVNLGIGLCGSVNTTGDACHSHSNAYFTLSATTPDSDDALCLASFDSFQQGWNWNGTAVVAVLQNKAATLWANVALICATVPGGSPYYGSVSEDSAGTTYNVTLWTPYAC